MVEQQEYTELPPTQDEGQMQQQEGEEPPISEEAILFGHLTLSNVPQDAIQLLFHFGITKLEQLELLNAEILEKMEITNPELQGLIVEAA